MKWSRIVLQRISVWTQLCQDAGPMELLSSILGMGGVGGVAEASQRLLGVEERLGDFPFSLARGPGFEASLDAWKIAGHAARVSFF